MDPHPSPWENGGLRLEGVAKQAMETGRNRLLITGFLFAVGFLMVGLRLVEVSLFQEGTEPRLAGPPPAVTFQMERGDIVDRNGVLLATSLATASLYADPARVLDAEDAARRLVQVLPKLSKAELLAKLQAKRRFVWLRRNLTPRQQYAVNRLGIPGLYFRREERRVYPHGRLIAHLVGFTGVDNNGLAGIERYFDDALRDGATPLTLSLDIRIQHVLHAELSRAMTEYEALGAAGLVLDASTGEVLAMV
ncbi:MAG: penicillin-binding protein 2, partial [Alphaproteobacteria bacterium]